MADDITDIRQLLAKYGGYRPTTQKENIPYLKLRSQYEADLKAKFNKPVSVFYMTDTHVKYGQSTAHLYNIAKHIKDTKPDLIIHGGDLWDCESLCAHIPNESYRARGKPSLKKDLDALHEAVQLLTEESGRKDWHMTLGNHEGWLWQFEDRNPEIFGFARESFYDIFNRFGWTLYDYCRYVDFGGVNFIHAPISVMGKPRGGDNIAKTAANKSVKDLVFGHTHRFSHIQDAKDGNDEWVTAINAGCTMPEGYRPDYAVGPLGWWYGVVQFTIDNGKIEDVQQLTLKKLRRMYG